MHTVIINKVRISDMSIKTNKVLVTSALPYVNNIPHLGNIIGSTLSADVYTRFLKMMGREVFYLCGSDEYGTATEIKARKEGLSCNDICSKYHEIHKEVYRWFNIGFDVYGRTSTLTQTQVTHEIFFDLYINNHIESKMITQMYCKKCDLYLADRYLQGYCYSDKCLNMKNVANGDQCDICANPLDPFQFEEYWCSICHEKPEIVGKKHLYFKLDNLSEALRKYFFSKDSTVKLTNNARNITRSFLETNLQSRCITRDLKWGTRVPGNVEFKEYLKKKDIQNFDVAERPNLDEYIDKVFYVWFDAPIGYLSILKESRPDDWQEWLKGDIIQLMAKDNVYFHTIVFPATLMGSNPEKYRLITGLSCTEYLDFQGQKFSKSKNVGIFGDNVIQISKKLDISEDYWRYYLMHIRPENQDSSFNWIEFGNIIKAELSFKIGNLINRCMQMCTNFKTTPFDFTILNDKNIFAQLTQIVNDYINHFENFRFRDALTCTKTLSDLGNKIFQENAVWKVINLLPSCQYDNLYNLLGCVNYIVCVAIQLLTPFMPKKCYNLGKNFIHKVNIQNILSSGLVDISNDDYEIPFKQMNNDIIKELSEMKTQ